MAELNRLNARRDFAAFLLRLASQSESPGEWTKFVVTHYTDEELESIRCDLVRLSIQRDPTGDTEAWQAKDRQQMLQWAQRLEGAASDGPGIRTWP